jgi:hypothetical protein
VTHPDALVRESGARLREAANRLPAALRAIGAAMPGYPSSSGGGGGGHSELTQVEALAMSMHRDLAVRARTALAGDLRACCVQLVEVAALSGLHPWGGVPGRPSDDVDMLQALAWALRAAEQLSAVRVPTAALQPADRLLAAATGIYGVSTRWGTPTKRTGDVERAVSPSELWCAHHLEHGAREPRRDGHGPLCRWCAEYQRSAGHLPPGEVVRLRGSGARVTLAVLRRWDPDHARRLERAS